MIEKYGKEGYAKHLEKCKNNQNTIRISDKIFNLMVNILNYEQIGFIMENYNILRKHKSADYCSIYWANPDNDYSLEYCPSDNIITKPVYYIWEQILKESNIKDPALPF